MELFNRLDRFCENCESLQQRAQKLQSIEINQLPVAVEKVGRLKLECDSLQSEFRQLDLIVRKLQSEFFSDEVKEIQEKFENVERVYIRVAALVRGQIEYTRLYQRLYGTGEYANQQLDKLKEKFSESPGEGEYRVQILEDIRLRLEVAWLKVYTEKASIADLDALSNRVPVTVKPGDGTEAAFPLAIYLEKTLADIEKLWKACGGNGKLGDAVKEQQEILAKQRTLEKTYADLSSYLDSLDHELERATNLNDALKSQETVFAKLSDEIDRNRADVEKLLHLANSTHWNDPSIKRLSGEWFRLEDAVRKRSHSLVSLSERYYAYVTARDTVKDEIAKAKRWRESPVRDLKDVEALLRDIRAQEPHIQTLKRDAKLLQEATQGPIPFSRFVNFADEAQQVKDDWKATRAELEAERSSMLNQNVDVNELDAQLTNIQHWIEENAKFFDSLRYATGRRPTKLVENLNALYNSLRDHVYAVDDVGRFMENVRPEDPHNIRLRFLESKSNLANMDDSVGELRKNLEKLSSFDAWLRDFEKGANAAPRLGRSAGDKAEVYNNLKWQLDFGLTRELTLQQLQDQQKLYPVLSHDLTPVAEHYYKIIEGLKRDCKVASNNAETHDRFDTIREKCNAELTQLENEIKSIETHQNYGLHVARERLQSLQTSLQHLEGLGSKIGDAISLADLVESQSARPIIDSAKQQAAELQKRYKRLLDKAKILKHETASKFDSLDRSFLKIDALADWLRRTQTRLQRALELKTTLEEKRRSLSELKDIAQDLDHKESDINEIHAMVATVPDDQFQSKARPLLKELNSLQAQLQTYIRTWETYVDNHATYADALRDLEKVVAGIGAELGRCEDDFVVADDQSANIQLQETINNIRDKVTNANRQHNGVSDLSRPLNTQSSKEGREVTRSDIRALRDQLKAYQIRLDRLADKLIAGPAAKFPRASPSTAKPVHTETAKPLVVLPSKPILELWKPPAPSLTVPYYAKTVTERSCEDLTKESSTEQRLSPAGRRTVETTRERIEVHVERRTTEEVPMVVSSSKPPLPPSHVRLTSPYEPVEYPARLKSPIVTEIKGGLSPRNRSPIPVGPPATAQGFQFSDKAMELKRKVLESQSTLSQTQGATIKTTTTVIQETKPDRSRQGLTVQTGEAEDPYKQQKFVMSPLFASKKFDSAARQDAVEIGNTCRQIEDIIDSIRRTIVEATNFNCPVDRLRAKYELLQLIESQKPEVAQLFSEIERNPNLRNISREQRNRIDALQTEWSQVLRDHIEAKKDLKAALSDSEELAQLNRSISHVLSDGEKALLRRPDCTTLADKENHVTDLKKIRRKVKDEYPSAHRADDLRRNLGAVGIYALPAKAVERIDEVSQKLKQEIRKWQQAANDHHKYLDAMDATNRQLDEVGPILAALNVKPTRDVPTAESMLTELWAIKTDVTKKVNATTDLLSPATVFLSPSARDHLEKDHGKMKGYWNDFLQSMIQNIIERVTNDKNKLLAGGYQAVFRPVPQQRHQTPSPAAFKGPSVFQKIEEPVVRHPVRRRRSIEAMEEIQLENAFGQPIEIVTAPYPMPPQVHETRHRNIPSRAESGYRTGPHTPVANGLNAQDLEEEPSVQKRSRSASNRSVPSIGQDQSGSIRRSGSWYQMEMLQGFGTPAGTSTPRESPDDRTLQNQSHAPDQYSYTPVSIVQKSGTWKQTQVVSEDDTTRTTSFHRPQPEDDCYRPIKAQTPDSMKSVGLQDYPLERGPVDWRLYQKLPPKSEELERLSFDDRLDYQPQVSGPISGIEVYEEEQPWMNYEYFGDRYEDRFVRLTPAILLIKTYCFPLWLPKLILPSEIQAVYYKKKPQAFKTPSWGCGCPATWWACHCLRELPSDHTNVVIDYGPRQCLKAFSVRNFPAFMKVLRPLIREDAPVINTLP